MFSAVDVQVAMYLAAQRSDAAVLQSPLLLVHGLGPGASAREMLPLFDHFSAALPRRAVAALELPGYGSSQRRVLSADAALMVAALLAALAQLKQLGFARPAHVCALGLSCEFAAAAALQQPGAVRSLALISPAGVHAQRRWLQPWLALPGLNRWLFRALATRAALRLYFEYVWDSPVIDEDLLEYSHRSAALADAHCVPMAHLGGALAALGGSESMYRRLQLPVYLAHGRAYRAPASPPRPGWQVQGHDSGAMPHYEHRALFCARYGAFIEGLDQRSA